MDARALITDNLTEIRSFADSPPQVGIYQDARRLVDRLCGGRQVNVPKCLCAAPSATLGDYHDNWDHQVWYHLSELVRLAEQRRQRATAQGADVWVNAAAPTVEQEMQMQLAELAKLRQLFATEIELAACPADETLVDDPHLSLEGLWEYPEALALERSSEKGVCWQGQNPGGDWMWLRQALPGGAVRIRFDLHPVSTIKGGLIASFCAKPVKPGTPLAVASSSSMADYYANFHAYHFSVNRGASGYCNLRRCGMGLIMLASFPDPCPQYGRWYSLEIVKAGPQVELRVDGRLAVCYVDMGIIQPVLEGGWFGLRHFQGFRGWHRNVRVAAVPNGS